MFQTVMQYLPLKASTTIIPPDLRPNKVIKSEVVHVGHATNRTEKQLGAIGWASILDVSTYTPFEALS